MKSAIIFALIVVFGSCVQIKSSADLALEAKLSDLKKTGWGKVAVGLLELQLQTGGPMGELVTAFQSLIKDLNFKLGSEQEEYRWAKAEHFELENSLNEKIRDARVRFGVASAHLENTLYPQRAQLEHLIAVDEQLIDDTEAAMAKATRERQEAQATYESNKVEHADALAAVAECQELVTGLLNGGSSFVQMKKAQTHLKRLSAKLNGFNPLAHLAKALVELAQDFADKSATQKVLNLLNDLEDNLRQSEFDLDSVNEQQIAAYEKFMEVCRTTITQAQARIDANQAELDVCNAQIAHQENLRDTAAADRDTNQALLDEEVARWDAAVAAYEDLIAELMAELDALDRVIQLFATSDMSDEMLSRIDW